MEQSSIKKSDRPQGDSEADGRNHHDREENPMSDPREPNTEALQDDPVREPNTEAFREPNTETSFQDQESEPVREPNTEAL